ncbi:MAG: bifunctional hydroxymethylpyrimidine kinase/phosphomethylpyrimidine kinase [Deltaproteobacteria bacterium]|nr:bifunctional hydroxymethylpyrimidine kinase/phosphomethylpyrimidine kinase [Deltaproteobacteria bacterium]
MAVLVVGSLALDSIETPFGKVAEILGGSAVYFSIAASFFAEVNLVGVVGKDFPQEHIRLLQEKNIDLRGLRRVDGKTFRWVGKYGYNLNDAQTLDTRLNVFEDFNPHIPDEYRNAEYVFLANIDPEIQLRVLKQVHQPRVIACDTMNFWIENKLEALKETIKKTDILIINEAETRELAKEANLVKACRSILAMGPKTLIIKQGNYGALMFTRKAIFSAPAFPLEETIDPTGAGDTFAGGFLGYIANSHNLQEGGVRQAVIFGSVMASFAVEQFSINRLSTLTYSEIEERYKEFKKLTFFEDI